MQSHISNFGLGEASWHTLGNANNTPLNFLGANGFPVASYAFFLRYFSDDFYIQGMDNRSAWPAQASPDAKFNWSHHKDDLIAFLTAQDLGPVDAIGHSIGSAVTLLSAIAAPHLFKRIVLIDPASLSKAHYALALKLAPQRFKQRVALIKSTLNRKNHWDSKAAFVQYLKTKRTYKHFTEEALQDYAEGGLNTVANGYQLKFAPEWEAHNYKNIVHIWSLLKKLQVPALVIRGEHSYLYDKDLFAQQQALDLPHVNFIEVKGVGHLAPQEGPLPVATAIKDWLNT